MSKHYLAIDLGAESGRIMLGTLTEGALSLEEIHRFQNPVVTVCGSLRWDILGLFNEIRNGLAKIGRQGMKVSSISSDSWGVDYVLIRGNEPTLGAPYNYRDARTDGGFERAFAVVPREEIFRETGIQFMTLNTLYQLHAHAMADPVLLKTAEKFLCIGDYINFLLCGVAKMEVSLASTTQLYNPKKKAWSKKLIGKFKFPKHLFPEVVASGTKLGPVDHRIAGDLGLTEMEVIATCSHDTGAAVAAVPAEGKNWAYLSCGTWSLMGVELEKPIINPASLAGGFTNEQGLGGTTRFLKNIIGLWIVQECRRAWAREGREYDYSTLTRMAFEAPPFGTLINPNDPRFGKPGLMPQKIQDFARETGQSVPEEHGAIIRCALESLACVYRLTLDELWSVAKRRIKTLHAVGGGIQNELLVQLTANATQVPVVAGPVEATALGNVLIQALTLGEIKSHEELRTIVRTSFPTRTFQPQDTHRWEETIVRFKTLVEKK
ncbi:MAG: rhamnulokinase family protein [Verrucomicrobiae bacterium]|nr:rhamnulokinase family protein [Verrucomicrobiae bacterium]